MTQHVSKKLYDYHKNNNTYKDVCDSQCQVNMSAIVSGIANSTIGLLCNKLRDYTAQKLNEGDINNTELRKIIVREIDDIRTKLDGLSRKDLLASLSFLKDGVNQLYTSLEKYSESCEKPSTSQAHTEDDKPESATAVTIKEIKGYVIDTTYDRHKFIGNLKIAERYQSAKKFFEEAQRLATEAFNNTGLNTEDRVMASQLRIAGRILGCLDDPEAAIHSCLLYLKELQDLPAVQAMFTVWCHSKKGFISGLRARFNKTERNDMIESIEAITGLLLNLTLQHTNMRTDCLDWPTINIGKEIHYPILRQKEMLKEQLKYQNTQQNSWRYKIENINHNCAVTSTGKILSRTSWKDGQHGLKITKPNGECSMFCTIPSDNDGGDVFNKIRCFAVDENDNVYIVIKISSRQENISAHYQHSMRMGKE